MINKIISKLTNTMTKINNKGFFRKLMDKNEPEVAASNFFIIGVLAIGLLLLAVPVFILIIEAIFNHTIATDLNGMASYIMAVAAIFTSAGITKIGVHYSDTRYPKQKKQVSQEDIEENCEEETPNENEEISYGKMPGD